MGLIVFELMVNPIAVTPDVEKTIAYIARVSNPKNQNNPNASRLIRYCIEHGHWSVFEHGFITVEITTSRAISAQLLRHRSMYFQEFSLRYAEALGFCYYRARRQDTKNRQASHDDLPESTVQWFYAAQRLITKLSERLYRMALDKGIAKECARFLLPLSTQTRIYVTGNVRSWIHYIQLRSTPETQLEHRDIALAVRDEVFVKELPLVSAALGWGTQGENN